MRSTNRVTRALVDVSVCLSIGVGAFYSMRWLDPRGTGEISTEFDAADLPAAIQAQENDYVADLMAAAEIVRERWSYREHRLALEGIEVDRLEREALAMLGPDPDPDLGAIEFERALTYLVAGLHDGHAGVQMQDYQVPGKYRWPFTLVEVEEGLMLDGIGEALVEPVEGADPNTVPALERGDLLLAVDDRPIDECIAEAERFVFSSTDGARRRQAIERMPRFDDSLQRSFLIRRVDGTELEFALELPRSFHSIETPAQSTGLESSRSHRVLEGNIGYFRPGNFSPPKDSGWPGPAEGRDAILATTYAEFDAIFAELEDTRALILDLRGNPGGTDLLGQFLVDRLVEPGYTYYRLSSHGWLGWKEFTTHGSTAPAGEHNLRGPLVCLLDEYTFSTADNVAACLADVHPNATFIGRPNGAGTGAPRRFDLPRTGTQIRFCTMRVQTPSGRMGEGLSVPLDTLVSWTRDDVQKDRDPDLERALQFLKR